MAQVGQDARKLTDGITRYAKRAAIALAGIGTAAAVVGSSFEFELMKTATVAQAFGKDLEDLRKKARELGSTTSFTAQQAAKGMYDLASAGMSTKEILAATGSAMKLAGATGSEMAQATHIVAATLRQFNLDAEESKRIVDTYAGAITNSLLTMEKLTEAMKYAGTTGAALGWSIEETTAAVAQFADLGLEGTMSGTNLRMAMIALSRQTDQMTNSLLQMGLTFEDINPETHNFGEILKIIGERGMDAKQAVDIFGARAGLNMRQLSVLAKEGKVNFDEFVEMLKKAQEGQGRAATMYDRMMSTFKGRWDIVISAMKNAGIEIFYIFEDLGRQFFDYTTGQTNLLTAWISENRGYLQTFALDIGKVFVSAAKKAVQAFIYVRATFGALVKTYYENEIKLAEEQEKKLQRIKEGGAKWWEKALAGGEEKLLAATQADVDANKEKVGQYKQLADAGRNMMEDNLKNIEAIENSFNNALETLIAVQNKIKEKGAFGPQTGLRAPEIPTAPKMPRLPSASENLFRQEKWFEEQLTRIRQEGIHNRFAIDEKANADALLKLVNRQQAERDAWEAHGAKEVDLARVAEEHARERRHQDLVNFKRAWESKLEIADQMAGGLAQITETLYTSGIAQNKKMFAMMKAFQMAQAAIAGAQAVLQALASWPPPISYVLAGIAGAMAAVQIAAIAKQQPQGYQEGGIVRGVGDGRGRTVRVGERGDEAIIPLKGGAVPVALKSEGKGTTIERHYHFEGSTFLDQATLKASMASIAVGAFENDYKGDGRMRTLVRAQP